MKRLLLYYLAIIGPLLLLVILVTFYDLTPKYFMIGLLLYALIYHPLISGYRLYVSGVIERKEIWRNFIPFWNAKYFEFLFFNKRL